MARVKFTDKKSQENPIRREPCQWFLTCISKLTHLITFKRACFFSIHGFITYTSHVSFLCVTIPTTGVSSSTQLHGYTNIFTIKHMYWLYSKQLCQLLFFLKYIISYTEIGIRLISRCTDTSHNFPPCHLPQSESMHPTQSRVWVAQWFTLLHTVVTDMWYHSVGANLF